MFRTNVQNVDRGAGSCREEHTGRRADRFTGGCADAVVIGGGTAGMATALRLRAAGLSPHPDDPEGHPAELSLLGAVRHGPVFLVRLWFWSYRRGRDRRRLPAEAVAPFAALVGGVLLLSCTPGLLVHTAMAIVGSWTHPLLTVYLPHHDHGDTPLTQTRTLRGRIIPAVFPELTYHLEHHLYPRMPSHHLPEPARGLEGHFAAPGVRPVRVV